MFVKENVKGDAGHDYWHALRVYRMAKKIAKKIANAKAKRNHKIDKVVLYMSAILHDIADQKFVDEAQGIKRIKRFLKKQGIDEQTIEKISYIILNISYRKEREKQKKKNTEETIKSIEFKIVQDADRLDAIGAIGIARVFSYSGSKNRAFFFPKQAKKEQQTAIGHFYQKLLLLKNKMNTKEARAIAEKRHRFMKEFLKEFYKEWEGKD